MSISSQSFDSKPKNDKYGNLILAVCLNAMKTAWMSTMKQKICISQLKSGDGWTNAQSQDATIKRSATIAEIVPAL